jgi:uncharacterized membrane protein
MSHSNALTDRRRVSARFTTLLVGAAVLFAIASYSVLLGDEETVRRFAGKEMIFEVLSAVLFLLTSFFYFALFRRIRNRQPSTMSWRRTACLVLAVFFLIACGEELSWGQHLFGFSTPQMVREVNRQQELNLHNLWFLDTRTADGERKSGLGAALNSNRLFDLFMLLFFVLVPIAERWAPVADRWRARLGIPLVPLSLGIPLLISWLLTAMAEACLVESGFMHLAVSEIREANYATLCFLGSWHLFAEAGEES